MLTVKQNGVRVVSPDLTTSQTEDFNRDSIFKILVVECGFQASHRDSVWTHTKDDRFSVQLDTRNNRFLFEYKYTSDSHAFPPDMTNLELISRFLETSRDFFLYVSPRIKTTKISE
jgi:hypothetical protein